MINCSILQSYFNVLSFPMHYIVWTKMPSQKIMLQLYQCAQNAIEQVENDIHFITCTRILSFVKRTIRNSSKPRQFMKEYT